MLRFFKACVLGCTEIAGSPGEGLKATVVQKLGPVKATFKGAVTISAMAESETLTISGEDKGGAAEVAKGGNVGEEALPADFSASAI